MMKDADDAGRLALRGQALISEGRDSEALPLYEQLIREDPAHSAHWINLGTVLRRLGRSDEALAAYIQAAARGENSPGFLYNVGLLHQDRGDYDSARRVLADAVTAAPDDVEIRLQYAQCCYESLHVEAATVALRDWRQLPCITVEQLATLSLLLLNLGEAQAAADAAARVAADPQPSPMALLRVAQVQERRNQVADARATLDRIGRLAGHSVLGEDLELLKAQIALRERLYDRAISQFQSLAANCVAADRRHLYLFPLAKALDARYRHDDAYRCLLEAHQAQMLHLVRTNPEAAGLREPPLLITRYGCSSTDIARWDESDAPGANDSPVFIVAFPRSGTTLLEQMLDAHPALVTMDEQPFLQQAIDRISDFGGDYPAGLARLTPGQLEEVRSCYWSLARRKASWSEGQRLIDKNPLNLLRLPAIRRLFPHARILLAIRHPCDVVLSCFMQHFRSPEFALLCRDLPTLARGYRRSFDFWYAQAALLRPEVLEVRYESLVADLPAQANRIMQFLGLDLDPVQLEPGAHALARGFISTPSYAQVIEPVHRRAIGRWEPYAEYFGEAGTALQPYLDRWGYPASPS